MYRIFLNLPDRYACGYYRAALPYRHCRDALRADGIDLVCSDQLDPNDEYGTYIFQRTVIPTFIPFLMALRERGKQIVWDFDDNLFEIPESSPAARGFDSEVRQCIYMAMRIANVISVSTAYLGESLGMTHKTVVVPNLIDCDDYPLPVRCDQSPITILWSGSITHRDDLRQIVGAVKDILNDPTLPPVRFVFFGDFPLDLESTPAHKVTFLAQVPLRNYTAVLGMIRPDIALAPLVHSEFNRCKSAIKYYEMAMAGAAVIATDIEPYREAIPTDSFGHLVGGGAARWARAIRRLIEDESERRGLQKHGRILVEENYSWQGPTRHRWLEFFRALATRHGHGIEETREATQHNGDSAESPTV